MDSRRAAIIAKKGCRFDKLRGAAGRRLWNVQCMKTTRGSLNALAAPPTGGETPGIEQIIARHPFFKGMSPHQLRLLGDCARLTRFQPGELILREGDPANRFYLIVRGKISLEAHAPEAGVTAIQTVEAGEALGWSWLFPPYYWHFDARAIEPTEAIFFYATPLREECETDHDLGYELIKRMAEVMLQRLQATRRKMVNPQLPPAMA